ncbi:MAG: flagellar basal-body rod protein FlgF [Nitratireductor sp.]
MEVTLAVATAAQRSLSKQLETVANNIANANTVGFRSEAVDFNTLVSTADKVPVHFPNITGVHASSMQGTHIETGNPYDLAISGDGFFAIQTPAGTAYTRDGRLQVTPFGDLQTIEGYPVLDSGNAPIQITDTSVKPTISPDGRILTDGNFVGEIGVYSVNQEDVVSRYGNSAFFTKTPAEPIAPGSRTTITQGSVESSNVNAMKELANMITIQQHFEAASSIIEKANETIKGAVTELSTRKG